MSNALVKRGRGSTRYDGDDGTSHDRARGSFLDDNRAPNRSSDFSRDIRPSKSYQSERSNVTHESSISRGHLDRSAADHRPFEHISSERDSWRSRGATRRDGHHRLGRSRSRSRSHGRRSRSRSVEHRQQGDRSGLGHNDSRSSGASAASWRHDRFEGGGTWAGAGASNRTRDDAERTAAFDDDGFDPYSSVRRSKAYDDDEPAGAGSGAGAAGGIGTDTDRDRAQQYPARSRSPRPGHDEYEWKSKAGGVAIFVKKNPSADK